VPLCTRNESNLHLTAVCREINLLFPSRVVCEPSAFINVSVPHLESKRRHSRICGIWFPGQLELRVFFVFTCLVTTTDWAEMRILKLWLTGALSLQGYALAGPYPRDSVDKLQDAGVEKLKAYVAAHAPKSGCTLAKAAQRKEWFVADRLMASSVILSLRSSSDSFLVVT
jgi:hypothetical protein